MNVLKSSLFSAMAEMFVSIPVDVLEQVPSYDTIKHRKIVNAYTKMTKLAAKEWEFRSKRNLGCSSERREEPSKVPKKYRSPEKKKKNDKGAKHHGRRDVTPKKKSVSPSKPVQSEADDWFDNQLTDEEFAESNSPRKRTSEPALKRLERGSEKTFKTPLFKKVSRNPSKPVDSTSTKTPTQSATDMSQNVSDSFFDVQFTQSQAAKKQDSVSAPPTVTNPRFIFAGNKKKNFSQSTPKDRMEDKTGRKSPVFVAASRLKLMHVKRMLQLYTVYNLQQSHKRKS